MAWYFFPDQIRVRIGVTHRKHTNSALGWSVKYCQSDLISDGNIPPNHADPAKAWTGKSDMLLFGVGGQERGAEKKKKVNPYLDLDLHMPFFTRLSLSLDKELNLVVVIIFIYSTSWHSACSGGKNLFKVGSIFQIKINYLYKYSYEHCNSIIDL